MSESKVRRVKKIPTDVSVLLHKRLLVTVAVYVVTDDGMTDRTQVNAYLMGSPSFDSHFEQRETTKRFDDLVFRTGGPPKARISSHARSDRRVS